MAVTLGKSFILSLSFPRVLITSSDVCTQKALSLVPAPSRRVLVNVK